MIWFQSFINNIFFAFVGFHLENPQALDSQITSQDFRGGKGSPCKTKTKSFDGEMTDNIKPALLAINEKMSYWFAKRAGYKYISNHTPMVSHPWLVNEPAPTIFYLHPVGVGLALRENLIGVLFSFAGYLRPTLCTSFTNIFALFTKNVRLCLARVGLEYTAKRNTNQIIFYFNERPTPTGNVTAGGL